MIRLPGGVLLLALPTEGYHGVLRVFSSHDNGQSWPKSVLVSSDLCYHPTLTLLPNNRSAVAVAWESSAPDAPPGANCTTGSCMVRYAHVPLKGLL